MKMMAQVEVPPEDAGDPLWTEQTVALLSVTRRGRTVAIPDADAPDPATNPEPEDLAIGKEAVRDTAAPFKFADPDES